TSAQCAGILCRDPNRCVASLDENTFRRFQRRHLESAIAWMDNETVLGLVVAPNLHRSGTLDVPFGTNCQLLAERIYVARPDYWLQGIGFVLSSFLPRPDSNRRDFTRARQKHQRNAASSALDRSSVRYRCDRIPGVFIAAVRFWRLH